MGFYGSGSLYGSGRFYTGATSAEDSSIPEDLRFYRTSQDGVYVFWWGFNPLFISPSLADAGFDLELDTASFSFTVVTVVDSAHLIVSSTAGMAVGNSIFQGNTTAIINSIIDSTHLIVSNTAGLVAGMAADYVSFSGPNLVTFTQLTAITFQNGNVRKGFAVPVAPRVNGIVQTWYARVRTHTGSFISGWSDILEWTIPMSVQQSTAEALMNSLPDYHVYGKGDLLKPVDQRKTNLWLVENMYGNQLDQVYYTTYLTRTNNFVDLCVDEDLYQNFGVMFNFPKPLNMQYVDYRWILINLYLASLVGGTNEAVILAVSAFTGIDPTITNVRDQNNFILTTSQDQPITQVLNTTTITTVIDGTHLVVGSTVGWVTGSALDTTVSVPFTVTAITDPTHLTVSSTTGMTAGDTIEQSVFYLSSPFSSELVVEDVTQGAGNPYLLTASTYAVLGDTAVTNTGNTVLHGDLGISPGTTITGFPPGTYSGDLHQGDTAAAQAHTDATAAATSLQGMGPGTNISSTDLNGFVATPGVYSATAAGTWTATGNLTLNGAGTYVFLFGTSLTVGANCSVILENGATADNVYFVTGTTFTFGANDTINGTILAGTSITFASNSVLNGRALTYGPSGTTVTFPSAGLVTVPASSAPGSGLIVPPSDYTVNMALGYFTMNTPTTHTLQATFDTGSPIKIFNPLQGATALSGIVTFTNGSTAVTGNTAVLPAPLLTANTYAVLAGTAVTNTGDTVLTGDLGVSPGSTVSGFPPGTFTGNLHSGDAAAAQAHTDATNAAATLLAMPVTTNITSTDLGGYVATPGHYNASAAGTWSAGPLTLNGAGTYIFSFGTSLTLPANATVVLTGGATAANVYFITGTTFTFGANNTVNGTILAGTSITFAASSVLNGRALCYGPSATTVTFPSAGTVTVPADSYIPGTEFLTQLTVGDQITDAGGIYLGTVAEILSNTSLVLANQWFGPTESVTAYRLQYNETQLPVPVLWDTGTLAFGVIITINDPGEFILPLLTTLESIVNQLVPASVKVYYVVVE
jgi:hypothetical protein